MAAGEGFEPSHTESESAVLPLHKPAKRKDYYTLIYMFVNTFLTLIFFKKKTAGRCDIRPAVFFLLLEDKMKKMKLSPANIIIQNIY